MTIFLCQVTPEIRRELKNSRNRGDAEDDLMSIYILHFFCLLRYKFSSSIIRRENRFTFLTYMNYLENIFACLTGLGSFMDVFVYYYLFCLLVRKISIV